MLREQRQRILSMAIALLIVFGLSYASQVRNSLYKDPIALWKDVVRKSPNIERPHYYLGTELKNIGRLDLAQREWEKTLELNPRHSWALNQMGTLWFLHKDYEKAEYYYQSSVQADINNSEANYNLAMLLEQKGDIVRSIHYYENFLRMATPEYYKEQIALVSRKVILLRASLPH